MSIRQNALWGGAAALLAVTTVLTSYGIYQTFLYAMTDASAIENPDAYFFGLMMLWLAAMLAVVVVGDAEVETTT